MTQTASVTDQLELSMDALREARNAVHEALAPIRRLIQEQDYATYVNATGPAGEVEPVTEAGRIKQVARVEQMVNDTQRSVTDAINAAHSVLTSLGFETRQLERLLSGE